MAMGTAFNLREVPFAPICDPVKVPVLGCPFPAVVLVKATLPQDGKLSSSKGVIVGLWGREMLEGYLVMGIWGC